MRRRLLRGRGAPIAASLIGLAALAGCGEVHTRTTPGPPRALAVALDAQPSALFAPIYEAQANGDFARGALAVRIDAPSAGESPIEQLTSHKVSVAIVSEPALIAARDSGARVVAIGALVRGPLESIISLGNHPIASAAALAGQTVASSGSPLAKAELATVLASAHVAPARVRSITVSGNLNAALESRKATATLGGFSDYDAVALDEAQLHPSVVALDAAGVPTFSDLVVAVRTGEANYDGNTLRAFLQSLALGEAAVRADPASVARVLAGKNRRLSERFELGVLAATVPASEPAGANQPFGFQNANTWHAFGSWMEAHGLLRHRNSAGFAFTDEFLPGEGE